MPHQSLCSLCIVLTSSTPSIVLCLSLGLQILHLTLKHHWLRFQIVVL
uniref:La ribonucleoprotein 4 n=1 Tax=Myotis myotis TaxID=51298 RepID=A0A7J7Z461_MYOMY|nr:La ribonucleoprotein 4 [Myotis myotis]